MYIFYLLGYDNINKVCIFFIYWAMITSIKYVYLCTDITMFL